jgi:type VI secretion system protein ImpK
MNALPSYTATRRTTDKVHGWVPDIFRTFCAEMSVLVHYAETGQMAGARQGELDGQEDRTAIITRRLHDLISRMEYEAGQRIGLHAGRLFEEVRYALVGLADEMLLAAEWPGRRQWMREPLELRLFGSQKAGQEIFDRIDKRLSGDTAEDRELALVYLMTLALGFRGPYRDTQGQKRIARLKDQLYSYFFHRAPDAELGQRRLVAEAYRNVLSEAVPRRLPYLRPWTFTAAMVLLLFLGISHAIWLDHTSGLRGLIADLVRTAG